MTDKKISELSSNGTLDGTESTVLVQSGSNVKALLSAIRSYIVNGYLTTSTASSTYQTIANSRYQFDTDNNTTYTGQPPSPAVYVSAKKYALPLFNLGLPPNDTAMTFVAVSPTLPTC